MATSDAYLAGLFDGEGRVFETTRAAANALGVSVSAVSLAKRKGTRTAGLLVEAA